MKKLSIVLIIIGISIIVSTLIIIFYTNNNINRMIAEYYVNEDNTSFEASTDTVVVNPEEEYINLQGAFEAEKISPITEKSLSTQSSSTHSTTTITSIAKPPKNQNKSKPKINQTILGIIKIDKIEVKSVIVEGVKNYNLSSGIGHLPGTSDIGQPGNCALAGHRSYTFGHFFNRLNELVVGDELLITTKKSDYKYKIYEILEVKPDDVSVLKGNKDESILTLITCTPIFIASHRLIIHARLVD